MDDPAIVLHRAQLHRLLADPLFGVTSSTWAIPALSRWIARCGTVMASRLTACSTRTRTKLPGSRSRSGFGEFAAQDHLASAGVDADIGEQQLARQRVGTAVILDQRGLGLVLPDLLQLPGTQGAAQVIQLAGRLGQVGVDRIQLLDQRQAVVSFWPTRAPSVTSARPIRPEIGAVTVA